MTKKKKINLLHITVFINIAFLIFIISSVLYVGYSFNHYSNTKNPNTMLTKDIKNHSNQTIVIFHREGCPDCKRVEKMIRKTEIQNKVQKDNISYVTVSTRTKEGRKLVAKYQVSQVPTIISFKDGKEAYRVETTDKNDIKNILNGKNWEG